ncbi:MAG: F0F1 ATP synthase subunit delta, partial [Planctomycetes bacterium]|nr:F0F1 ATP synthase subunit delta [Planctomycetota bacterium]
MSQQEILAKRYAAGLAEAARDKGEVAAVRTDLRLLTDMLTPRGSMFMPEFRDFMESPLAARSDKLNLAEKVVAAAGIGPTVASFFAILIEKNRVGVIAAISRNYSEISGEMSGELTALVRTARPLSDD